MTTANNNETAQNMRESQEREGRARLESRGIDPSDVAAQRAEQDLTTRALESPDADAVGADDSGAPRASSGGDDGDPPAPRSRPLAMSPSDERRNRIIRGYRREQTERTEEAEANDREITAALNAGLPPELQDGVDTRSDEQVETHELAPDELPQQTREPPPRQPQQPTKRKLVVRGREVELSDEELVEHAQKSLAHDDYLSEARSVLDEVKGIKNDVLARLPANPGIQAPGEAEPGEQPGDQPPADTQAHADFVALAEALQYKPPEEAAAALQAVMAKMVTPAVSRQTEEEAIKQKRASETARSQRALGEFMAANPEFADDEAQAVVRVKLFKAQREDLLRLARDKSKVPTDPNKIAEDHNLLRADGLVRPFSQLLEDVKAEYTQWRNPNPQPTTDQQHPQDQQQPQPRQVAPQQPQPSERRVEVSVNRDARRAAIPQQPSRTVVPQQNPQQRPQEPRDRSAVALAMQAQRRAMRQPTRPA